MNKRTKEKIMSLVNLILAAIVLGITIGIWIAS